ncbi:MAG: hypothetical protein V1908_02115 [Candidatus Peregrinibacteria bacterium]
MFHNRTTLWHFPTQSDPVGQKRLTFAFVDSIKGFGSKIAGFGRGTKTFLKIITLPIWLPFYPLKGAARLAGRGLEKGAEVGTRSAFAVAETVRTLAWNVLGKPFTTLAAAPFVDVWRTVGANTRDIIKGIFRIPVNVVRTPKAIWNSMKESGSNFGHGVANLATFKGDFWNSVKHFKLFHPITSTRKMVGEVMGGIGGVVLPNAARAHLKASFEIPIDVSRNVVTAKTQYLSRMRQSFGEFIEGAKSVPGAPARGYAKGVNPVDEFRKARAALKVKQDEAAKKATGREAAKVKQAVKKAA